MTTHEWSPPYAGLLYVAVGLGLLLMLILARQFARSPVARSWLLLLVRGGVLAGLLILLLNPVRVHETQLPPTVPELIYLIDCSRSMALDQPVNRLEAVKDAIAQSKRLASKASQPRINLYRFGSDLQAVLSDGDLTADDDSTNLAGALERLPGRFGDSLPKGVVVFSDGRITDTSGLDGLVTAYRRMKIPIHVFPVGEAD
ncbi:MAG TPA: vWA domain-containing protein, partial [Gemmataceae bacterium]|nr:vWA domain-containing protein [Gemmataceae bacterium]